jgi:hypothetical protein
MPDQFRVNDQAPLGLNLRREPDPSGNNIIALIPFGNEVTKLADSSVANWWKVQATLNGTSATGFVNQRFLTPVASGSGPVTHTGVVPVHLTGTNVTRQNEKRAFPLSETPPTRRHAEDQASVRVNAINQLIDWFNVESSARYRPAGGATFCNIYAYDYCFMTEAYLPRVWWTQQAIVKLVGGQSVPVKFGETVNEITANGLTQWFKDWGPTFGWRRTLDLTELQDAANQGKVCITVAKASGSAHNGHGHIVAVVPETSVFKAVRVDGKVTKTVQSQAGGHNAEHVVRSWWNDGSYSEFGHWIHD